MANNLSFQVIFKRESIAQLYHSDVSAIISSYNPSGTPTYTLSQEGTTWISGGVAVLTNIDQCRSVMIDLLNSAQQLAYRDDFLSASGEISQ